MKPRATTDLDLEYEKQTDLVAEGKRGEAERDRRSKTCTWKPCPDVGKAGDVDAAYYRSNNSEMRVAVFRRKNRTPEKTEALW